MNTPFLLTLLLVAPTTCGGGQAVRLVRDVTSAEGLPAYRIETPVATYMLEKAGAGLASLVDRDGNDWLGFSAVAGTGAEGEYRGFPNAVHQQAGNYFHARNAATDPAVTQVVRVDPHRVTISAESDNHLGACQYDFFATHCTFTMTRMPRDKKYWVLYEGTPGGACEPEDWWMTSAVEERQPLARKHTGDIPAPEWIAFGDRELPRVLFLLHHEDDDHPDDYYEMNQQMTVFGFGRHRLEKYIDQVPQSYSIGFLETTDHAEVNRAMQTKLTAMAGSVLLLTASSMAAGDIQWDRKSSVTGDLPIPCAGQQQTCCVAADFDGDGVQDFVVGERTKTPSVVWYKYNGKKGWDKRVIDNSPLRPEAGGICFDVDGDGDQDLILGQDASGAEMWWWENPCPNFSRPWKRRLIKQDGARKHHDQTVGDFDGDGKLELITWNQGARQLLLYEIPANPRTAGTWSPTVIYAWKKGQELEGFPSTPVDIDLDGQIDIVGGGRWFKHQDDSKFRAEVIDDEKRFTQCAAGQLVKGGRPEVVFSPGDMDGNAKWYQWQGGKWVANELGFVVHGHTCEVGDVDRDGNLDILIGEMGNPGAGNDAKTFVWYGDGQGAFRKTVVSQGQGIHEGLLSDLDGDGDLDILMKPYNHNSPRVDVLLQK